MGRRGVAHTFATILIFIPIPLVVKREQGVVKVRRPCNDSDHFVRFFTVLFTCMVSRFICGCWVVCWRAPPHGNTHVRAGLDCSSHIVSQLHTYADGGPRVNASEWGYHPHHTLNHDVYKQLADLDRSRIRWCQWVNQPLPHHTDLAPYAHELRASLKKLASVPVYTLHSRLTFQVRTIRFEEVPSLRRVHSRDCV
jgi:hypothetical protein